MSRNFSVAMCIVAIGFMLLSITISALYIEKDKELKELMKRAYFQSYLPESGKELVMNFSNGGCFVYRCYRLNNSMDCYITEGVRKNTTCYLSGPTYGMVCRNLTSGWKCFEMSSAKRVHYLNVMTPILYYDKVNSKCCWITGMKNGEPSFNCTESSLIGCVNQLLK